MYNCINICLKVGEKKITCFKRYSLHFVRPNNNDQHFHLVVAVADCGLEGRFGFESHQLRDVWAGTDPSQGVWALDLMGRLPRNSVNHGTDATFYH